MAGNDITLKLLEAENTFLRDNLSEQRIRYDSLLKREVVLKNIAEALRQQRNESEEKYIFFKKEHAISSATMMDQINENEKKLKKCEEQMQEYQNNYEEEKNIKSQTQSEQNNILRLLVDKQKKLYNKQEELFVIQKQLIIKQEELTKLKDELHEKADQIRDMQEKLKSNEETIIYKHMLQNQTVQVRSALSKFEEQKIPNFQPVKRGGTLE